MKRYVVGLLLAIGSAHAQGITSITCWRDWIPGDSGYTSCYKSTFSGAPAGAFGCSCSATCGNCNNIGASYEIWWATTSPLGGRGSISGAQQSYAVRVGGETDVWCTIEGVSEKEMGSGYSTQDCDGNESYADYDLTCSGGG